MKRLCTINARGGSKGVKDKNIREINGIPLIAYSIIQAKKSGLFDSIAVSSDSDLILKIAKEYGAEYLIKRPEELATDTASKLTAIKHCVLETERLSQQTYDIIVDLDATSPLREIKDIVEAIKLLEEKKVSNVITGMSSRRSPYFNLVELNEEGFVELAKKLPTEIIRRQDAPKTYDMNASIYVWIRESLLENNLLFHPDTLLYEMPEERSFDIDSELDFQIVEFIMLKRGKENG